MRGSSQVGMLLSVCEGQDDWYDYLNPLNLGDMTLEGLANSVGFCDDNYHALAALVPVNPHTWAATPYGCATPGYGPSCPANSAATYGGAHAQFESFCTHWFDSTTSTETCSESCGSLVSNCGWRGCDTNFFCNLSCAWSYVTSSVCEERATCENAGVILNYHFNTAGNSRDVVDGIIGDMCGHGNGGGFVTTSLANFDSQSFFALIDLDAITGFGQGSDGNVPYSSCEVGDQSRAYTPNSNSYDAFINHVDLTTKNGEGTVCVFRQRTLPPH